MIKWGWLEESVFENHSTMRIRTVRQVKHQRPRKRGKVLFFNKFYWSTCSFTNQLIISFSSLPVSDNINNNNNQSLNNHNYNQAAGSSGISGGLANNASVYKPVPPPKPLSPPYRMPPPPTGAALYNEQLPPIPGATCSNYEMQSQNLRTHSSKFPVRLRLL